jgi:glutaredoxin
MEIKIYTTRNCGYCGKIKELLNRMDLEYTEYRNGENLDPEVFKAIFPNVNSYPQIVVDGMPIENGLTGAVRFFVEKGMISSKKDK